MAGPPLASCLAGGVAQIAVPPAPFPLAGDRSYHKIDICRILISIYQPSANASAAAASCKKLRQPCIPITEQTCTDFEYCVFSGAMLSQICLSIRPTALCAQAKSATQQYKNAVQNNSKAVHDALATATAKGVEDAHVKVTSGSAAYPSAPGITSAMCEHAASYGWLLSFHYLLYSQLS